jgi:hypothetical protein
MEPSMVIHTYNSNTPENKAGRRWVQDQTGLSNKPTKQNILWLISIFLLPSKTLGCRRTIE